MDTATFRKRLEAFTVETPSWGLANSGTRFGTFRQPWAAKELDEKLADAGQVQKYTGICPRVALHIPWDKTGDWSKVQAMAKANGVAIGAINPNVFQDECYQFGSITNSDPAVRRKAVEHHIECIEIAKATGSDAISLWYADGTNYPGQESMRARKARMLESLQQVYAKLPTGMRMLVEYKPFEPAFYHTDIQDWGSSLMLCQKLGPQAQVLVDTGHHLQGTNIEHIVAILLDEGRLGGFHFNDRKYADDDLTVGAINPYQLFLIFAELVAAEEDPSAVVANCAKACAYMFDQCPNHKPTIESVIQSAVVVQETWAKALLIDRAELKKAQDAHDLTQCEELLKDAFSTDVRPRLAEWRQSKGLDANPLAAFRRSGYLKKVAEERAKKRGAQVATGAFG
ncbi:MAG: L-rhamnose isomerase [Planctomycetes bacterium]|nr:L-rhamnose isomerase [Planctomycetota bacterium]